MPPCNVCSLHIYEVSNFYSTDVTNLKTLIFLAKNFEKKLLQRIDDIAKYIILRVTRFKHVYTYCILYLAHDMR